MATENILKINANELDAINEPEHGQSILIVDRATNEGLQIDYDKLASAILKQIVVEQMPSDGLKFVVVGN